MIIVILAFLIGGIIILGIPLFTGALLSLLLWQARRKKVIDAKPWSKVFMFTLSLLGAIALAALCIYLVFEYLPGD
jgi:formate hydrogenlyase subunit 3/multisubunit Na+/H+ antiporter MnhD subunit